MSYQYLNPLEYLANERNILHFGELSEILQFKLNSCNYLIGILLNRLVFDSF